MDGRKRNHIGVSFLSAYAFECSVSCFTRSGVVLRLDAFQMGYDTVIASSNFTDPSFVPVGT
jgi:hypothetical protein